ncbi:hypothetical protein [Vibrio sp. D431a]|uniref:hypothetical protein n=1 Tax=Vibrio sp. D431a TaxID=2837388 RepID=UPI00255571BE|nr:hypothetical protein [Vibrio sp. D431a]MDK9789977.1 hypothetical protein [Vibrio sp. D431a]
MHSLKNIKAVCFGIGFASNLIVLTGFFADALRSSFGVVLVVSTIINLTCMCMMYATVETNAFTSSSKKANYLPKDTDNSLEASAYGGIFAYKEH